MRAKLLAGSTAAVGLSVLAITFGLMGYRLPRALAAPIIPDGTVMVSTGDGLVTAFDQDGNMITQLDTTTAAPEETGSAFDTNGNFFVTNFTAQSVSKFDPTGTLIGSFGSGYNADPESILFDAAGDVYVGQADGTHRILKFDSTGAPLATFSPAVEDRGSDWLDLASDQCTMFYTSEGVNVKRFNVCTNTQLADFNTAPLPGAAAFAHRILLPFQFGAGGVLVADSDRVVRLDNTGALVQTYTFPISNIIFTINLDPDGTSFWTSDLPSGTVYKVDIASGTILKQWSAAGAPNFADISGLSVKGELTAPLPPPDCSAAAASSPLLWPPNHKFVKETVEGVTAVNGPVTIDITSIQQDEPTLTKGSGNTCPDGKGVGTASASVRSERAGNRDGRVYHIGFTATDTKNQICKGEVTVCVPHDQGHKSCIDEGALFDSTVCP